MSNPAGGGRPSAGTSLFCLLPRLLSSTLAASQGCPGSEAGFPSPETRLPRGRTTSPGSDSSTDRGCASLADAAAFAAGRHPGAALQRRRHRPGSPPPEAQPGLARVPRWMRPRWTATCPGRTRRTLSRRATSRRHRSRRRRPSGRRSAPASHSAPVAGRRRRAGRTTRRRERCWPSCRRPVSLLCAGRAARTAMPCRSRSRTAGHQLALRGSLALPQSAAASGVCKT